MGGTEAPPALHADLVAYRLRGRDEDETIKTAYYRGARMAENQIAFMGAVAGKTTSG